MQNGTYEKNPASNTMNDNFSYMWQMYLSSIIMTSFVECTLALALNERIKYPQKECSKQMELFVWQHVYHASNPLPNAQIMREVCMPHTHTHNMLTAFVAGKCMKERHQKQEFHNKVEVNIHFSSERRQQMIDRKYTSEWQKTTTTTKPGN